MHDQVGHDEWAGMTALALTTVGFFHRYEKTAYGLFGETGSRLPEEAQSNKNRAAPCGVAPRYDIFTNLTLSVKLVVSISLPLYIRADVNLTHL